VKAPPPQTDRPALDSDRHLTWHGWLFQEWGLLILAAVMAIIIWEITSSQVISELQVEDVRVELVIAGQDAERIGAVLNQPDTRVTLEMNCSERERHAIHAALTKAGGGIPVLRLQVNPEVGKDASRAISSSRDAWLWPVDNASDIGLRAKMPPGRVYKIEGVQQVNIARPPTIPDTQALAALGYVLRVLDPDTSAAADIKLSKAFLEFRAPRAVFAAGEQTLAMTPDALDLRPLLEATPLPLGKLQTFELSFNGWAAAEQDRTTNDPAEQTRVAQFRSNLPLERVTAKLVLERVEARAFTGRLEVLLHPDFTWDFEGQAPDEIVREIVPLTFKGKLSGPADALAEIEKAPELWDWAIWVSRPDKGWPKASTMGAPDERTRKGVRANIVWVPLNTDWVRRGVRFVPDPAKGEDQFFLKLGLRSKDG